MGNCTRPGIARAIRRRGIDPAQGPAHRAHPAARDFLFTNGGARNSGGGFVHMMPRADGIVLGGTSQRGIWTLEPDEDERKRVVDTHIALFNAMHPAAPGEHVPAPVTPDAPPSLESHFDLES